MCKVLGLYDRDDALVHKTTLDEAPALFQVATVYTLVTWIAQNSFVPDAFTTTEGALLWPLVFVLLSVAALNEPLRRLHYVALVLAFCGAALLLSQGETRFVLGEAVGYALGLACAVTWGANSVAMRARPEAPSGLVAGYCAISAVLAFVGHRLFETTAWPKTATDLLPAVLLALGPAGGAFFAWDYGVKRGNVALLGALAFATPVLSTFCLVVLKRAEATWQLALSCLAITVAAALARIAGALRPEEQRCAARR
jgi:drug/metabolite transporter (DMT)-like permease